VPRLVKRPSIKRQLARADIHEVARLLRLFRLRKFELAHDAATMARVGGWLLIAGATEVLASLALPGGPYRNDTALLALLGLAYLAGVAQLVAGGRTPALVFPLATAAATVTVTAGIEFAGRSTIFLEFLYFWIVFYAAYFFPAGVAIAQLTVVVAALGFASLLFEVGERQGSVLDRFVHWILLAGTIAVAAGLLILLKYRLARLLEQRTALLERAREQNARLRELDRLKDEFVALVSHELRTPLTSVRGYLELLLDRSYGELNTDQRAFVEVVHRNSERLLLLVGDLLLVAQIEAGQLDFQQGDVDLEALLEEALEAAVPAAGAARIALELEADQSVHVRGDRARLAQLIDNLISNAIKFTSAGGEVSLRLSTASGTARIEVADSGMGICREDQERLFDRFFRTAEANKRGIPGTGLGLVIAKAIVEGHGGMISVSSEPGAGTTFVVELPEASRALQGQAA
jgi:signal transduction histidine kinase